MPLHLCRRPPGPHSPRQQWLGCAVAGPLPFCALCVSAPLCDNRFPFISSPCPLCPLCVLCVNSFLVFSLFSPLLFRPIQAKIPINSPALTHLDATLPNHPTSVDSKQLTTTLNPPESTLTKNMGGGGVMVNHASDEDACPERAQRVEGPLS